MKPRWCDVIEEISLESSVPDDIKYQIIRDYSDSEITKLSEIWLKGIGARHQVPGYLVGEVAGIGDYYRRIGVLSPKQRWLVFMTMIQYWNEMSLGVRTSLDL